MGWPMPGTEVQRETVNLGPAVGQAGSGVTDCTDSVLSESQEAQFSQTVPSLSCVQLFETSWTAACQASLSITNSRSLLKFMSNESLIPGSCQTSESTLRMRWPKYWSFSLSISPSNEYSGLMSFRMDWLDLLAVQGTLKSLLQHHISKASILQCSAFFIVSHIHT